MLFIRRLRASACGPRMARGGTCKRRSDSDRVRAEHEVGDDTDRWSPPGGERKGEEREMADWAEKEELGRHGVWAVREKEKRGERKIWAVGGLQEKKKKEGEGEMG